MKKKTKAGTSARLGPALAAQPHHQRDQIEAACSARATKGCHILRIMRDVGIGQQHIGRVRRELGQGVEPVLHRPQLAGPAGGQGPRRNQLQRSAASPAAARATACVPSLL